MASPCPIVGQSSHARPSLPVWWPSAIEEDVATYLGRTAKSQFSEQGSVGVSEKYLMETSLIQSFVLTPVGRVNMEKTLSLPCMM